MPNRSSTNISSKQTATSMRPGGRVGLRSIAARARLTSAFLSAWSICGLIFCIAGARAKPAGAFTDTSAQHVLVNRYCSGCHSGQRAAGQFDMTKLNVTHPEQNAQAWEKVFVKLHSDMMPPARAPRPDRAAIAAFLTSLETRIDAAAAVDPNPGRPALHRLNRTEYANSVRDLLTLDVDVTSLLPADDMSHGFDNMAEVLNLSPALLESYVRAAGKISRAAVGEPKAAPVEEIHHLPSTLSQVRHIEGTPFGTRGGAVIHHNFPANGEYVFKVTLYFTTNRFLFGMYQKGEQIEVALNGARVALFDINPLMKVDDVLRTPPIKVTAGPQTVTVAFIEKASGPVEDFVQPFDHTLGDLFLGRTQGLTGLPHLRDVAVDGPYHVTGVSETPSRRRIFVCRPNEPQDELPCARTILTMLARRAYRRPATDADVKDLLSIYRIGRKNGTFEDGIRLGVQFILANPQFVFRFERTPANARAGANYRLTDPELASRLSYFLWSSSPDTELIDLASQGRLKNATVLQHEVRRMLADRRSEALATNFAGQWLQLRNIKDVQPDLFAFPDFNFNLLQSMRRETELFFTNLVREDRSVTELLTADYTFLDENLAKHYGIPDIEGPRFRRVKLTDENRRGLLGQGAILTVTSFANRTSPVVRGKWIMDTLLGAPPPKQPANVPPLKEITEGATPRTVRERLEEHRKNPFCASCHTMMDPLGFALENFDATGAWRSRDNGFRIDTRGRLVNGTLVDSPRSLRKELVAHSDAFLGNFTRKLLTYALGRGIEYYDMPAVRAIDRGAARNGNRFSSYVLGIVQSTPFQMRRAASERPRVDSGTPLASSPVSGGNHVHHQEASFASRAPARHGRLVGAAPARFDGSRTDAAAQNGSGSENTAGSD